MILRAIRRLILVPRGCVAGAGVAMAVLVSLGLERITHAMAGRTLDDGGIEFLFDLARGFVSVAGAATVVPALLVVVVGEVARIRSALYYVLGGGIAVAILPVLARAGSAGPAGAEVNLAQIWPVLATAGFAGGLTYWLLAGRRA